jgi:ADP-ribose pyrophosphatase YjhB (NUDIX family)
MKYCSGCGQPVSYRIPPDDNRQRYVCDHCGVIHYQNPRIVVGSVPVYQDQVLLCLRAIEPRKGFWTLPAGFMENGETCSQGAQRETQEEACAAITNLQLYTLFDLPRISQVYMFYRADLVAGEYAAGQETLDAGLFSYPDIPWDQLAFPVVAQTLEYYFADCEQGRFPVRSDVINRPYIKPQDA